MSVEIDELEAAHHGLGLAAIYGGEEKLWPIIDYYRLAVQASSPAHWWPLGDPDNQLRDESGTVVGTYHGTYSRQPSLLPTGLGRSTLFNGGYADILGYRRPGTIPPAVGTEITLEFLVSVPGTGQPFDFPDGLLIGSPGITGNPDVRFTCFNYYSTPAPGVLIGTWLGLGGRTARVYHDDALWPRTPDIAHIVVTMRTLAQSGTSVAIADHYQYINNERWQAFYEEGPYTVAAGAATAGLRIGASGHPQYFRARLQHLAIYNRVLPAAEVKTHYDAFLRTS